MDTNVIFSATYDAESQPGRIFQLAALGHVQLFSSEEAREEVRRAFRDKLEYSKLRMESAIESLPVQWVPSSGVSLERVRAGKVIGDRKDAHIVAVALYLELPLLTSDRRLRRDASGLVDTVSVAYAWKEVRGLLGYLPRPTTTSGSA